ncbi:TolB family protein [candidate division KSB1 bacterium]
MKLSKNRIAYSAIVLLLFTFSNFISSQDSPADFSKLTGPYLGQKPPGMIPEVFAPGIISIPGFEGCSGFNLKADLFVFERNSESPLEIFITRVKNGKWIQPVLFSGDSEFSDGDFTFAPDGKAIYLTSRRPLKGDTEGSDDSNIWKTVFTGNDWSEPVMLGDKVNTDSHDSYPSAANDGTIYFFSRRPGGFGTSDIYVSKKVNGNFMDAVNLGKIINTEYEEWDPFIAPDESYLIFCSTKPESYGRDDLYISFRSGGDSWTRPVNMGDEINSIQSENRPYLTPDGKYFFFTSDKSGDREIYWVDAKIIDTFKPDDIR